MRKEKESNARMKFYETRHMIPSGELSRKYALRLLPDLTLS